MNDANKDREIELLKQKIQVKDREIELLKHRDSMHTDSIGGLTDKIMQLMKDVEKLKKERQTTT
jgi:hypothetical protein